MKITGNVLKFIVCAFVLMSFIAPVSSSRALEIYAAADSTGTALPGGILNVEYATPTDIWLFAKFSQSEAQAITANSGINSASYLMMLPNVSTVASVTSDSTAVTNGLFATAGWISNSNSEVVLNTQYYTRAGSAGLDYQVADPGIGNYTLVPLVRVTIAPVAVTPTSTVVTLNQDAPSGNFWFTGNFKQFEEIGVNFTPTTFTLNVVPEPSTYALAASGIVVLGYIGRRRKNHPLRAGASV